MSLRQQILNLFTGKKFTINEVYQKFPEQKRTTIRARIYESVHKKSFSRIGHGLYISANCILEHGDSLTKIDSLLSSNRTFDLIYLDIPYLAGGQKSFALNKGGNRNLSDFSTISPAQFSTFISKC